MYFDKMHDIYVVEDKLDSMFREIAPDQNIDLHTSTIYRTKNICFCDWYCNKYSRCATPEIVKIYYGVDMLCFCMFC